MCKKYPTIQNKRQKLIDFNTRTIVNQRELYKLFLSLNISILIMMLLGKHLLEWLL